MRVFKKDAFTMIEIIIVIVISAILSAGTFIALKEIYLRAAKSKAITELSSSSSVLSAQIASLLQNRVPSSVIGYDINSSNFQSIYNIDRDYNVLEWIGVANESFNHRDYSSFIDMDDSNQSRSSINSPLFSASDVNATLQHKFNTTEDAFDNNLTAIIFAGSFDDGELVASDDFNSSFGWHGNEHNLTYTITDINGTNLTISPQPHTIYEKYYLVDSAYAIARGADLNRSRIVEDCHFDISFLSQEEFENTLFLFYDYRPWRDETFCADANILHSEQREGNVTILSKEAQGFRVNLLSNNLQFSVTLQRDISSDGEHRVTISKQRVIF